MSGRNWTVRETKDLVSMRMDGLPWCAIGRRLDRTATACATQWRKMPRTMRDRMVSLRGTEMTLPQRIGSQLRALRDDAGQSLEDVAYSVGVHTRTLKRLEAGDHISTPTLWAVLVHFDADLMVTK